MKSIVPLMLVVLAGWTAGCGEAPALPPFEHDGAEVAIGDDPYREFDFWVGEWDVANKHLRRGRWVDSGSAKARIEAVAEGAAVLERWTGELGGDPLIGFSLRAYDPELGKWSVWLNWHGGNPGGFSLMHGTRHGERMELLPPGGDTPRYTFSQAHEGSCQWDRANLVGGEWKTDWVMQFRRSAPASVAAAGSTDVEMPPDAAAEFEETRRLDFLLGRWTGAARFVDAEGNESEGTVSATVTSMIAGFGMLQFLDTSEGDRTMTAFGHDSGVGTWVGLRASNRRPGLPGMTVEVAAGGARFIADDLSERWRCEGERCTWTREVSGSVTIHAELSRVD